MTEFKVGQKIKCLSPMSWEISGTIIEIDSHPFEKSFMKIKVDGLPFRGHDEAWVDVRFCTPLTLPSGKKEKGE